MVLWRQRNIFDLMMTLHLLLNIMEETWLEHIWSHPEAKISAVYGNTRWNNCTERNALSVQLHVGELSEENRADDEEVIPREN